MSHGAHDLATAIGDARLLCEATVLAPNCSVGTAIRMRRARYSGLCTTVVRARRAVRRGSTLGSLVGRAMGRPLGACGRLRRARMRHQPPVRGRDASGLHCHSCWLAVYRGQFEFARGHCGARLGALRAATRASRPATSWRSSGSSPSGAATRPTAIGSARPRRPAGRDAAVGVSRAPAGGAADYAEGAARARPD